MRSGFGKAIGWVGTALCIGTLGAWGKAPDDTVICRVEVDRGVLPAGEKQKATLKITLDGVKPETEKARPPVNLAIVLDRSGSMSSQHKLEKAKDAAIEALRRLDERDLFSLVIYDTSVETLVPAQSAGNRNWIESRIRQVSTGGNTALFGGVSQGAAEVRKNLEGKYAHRIILLSDGLANVGPSSPEDLARLGAALIKEGISVTTVGVGTDYNEDLMTRLAQKSDGNTYFVAESAELPRIFNAELGDALSVVAKKVKIVIECPDGVTPVSVLGREGRIKDRTVELYLNQLYGGQEKYILVEIEVPLAKAGESREVAVARISYENPLTGREAAAAAKASAKFSDSSKEVDASVNITVQRAAELNRNAMVQDDAIALADKGRTKEAVKKLAESAEQLKQVGVRNADPALVARAGEMKAQAEKLDAEGMDAFNRKMLRAEAAQTVNQQAAH